MKYFVCSDIHSFYEPFIYALNNSGYNKNNPNHILIVLGDIFDRGNDSKEVYNFLRSIPKTNRILVRGNHEILLRDAIRRQSFLHHDITNGTFKTICTFLDLDFFDTYEKHLKNPEVIDKELCKKFNNLKIVDWIFGEEWVNYYELDNYILVHSFIPSLNVGYNIDCYLPEWRTCATDKQWEDAMWGCPFIKLTNGLLGAETKTLICGHWNVNDFHKYFEGSTIDNYNMFISKKIIALDACTPLSHKINVLVLVI